MSINAPIYPYVDIPPETLREIETKRARKIVFTFGAFDLLNSAHMRLLNYCRKNGDVLVVGLYTDAAVHTVTNDENRPINELKERVACLREFGLVDYIYQLDGNNTIDIVDLLRPDVIVIGENNKHGADICSGEVITARIDLFKHVNFVSTTSTISRVCERYL